MHHAQPLLASTISPMFYVYVYRDPRSNKELAPFYVGKGKAANNRAQDHLRHAKNRLMRAVLRKISALGLSPIIEIDSWHDNQNDAHAREIELIALYGRRDIGTGSLCNLTDGGEGTVGAKLPKSEEAKAKMAAAKRGKKLTEDHRAALAAAHRGRTHSPETRAKMSAWQIGRKRPEETCKRIGDGHRGKTLSAETRAKMSAVRKGRPIAPETKEKMRIAALRRAAERKLQDDELRTQGEA